MKTKTSFTKSFLLRYSSVFLGEMNQNWNSFCVLVFQFSGEHAIYLVELLPGSSCDWTRELIRPPLRPIDTKRRDVLPDPFQQFFVLDFERTTWRLGASSRNSRMTLLWLDDRTVKDQKVWT
jgi:hypothetical protein